MDDEYDVPPPASGYAYPAYTPGVSDTTATDIAGMPGSDPYSDTHESGRPASYEGAPAFGDDTHYPDPYQSSSFQDVSISRQTEPVDEFGVKPFDISVSDPIKQGDGMNAFVTYTVTTRTSLPQFQRNQFSVIRRYRDFLWLREQLLERHEGVIIPPLPEKALMGRFNPEFVETRRTHLEKFLNRVGVHPMLYKSLDLQTFLEAGDETLETAKMASKERKKGQKGGVASSLASTFSKFTQSGSDPNAPQDTGIEDLKKIVEDMDAQLCNMAKFMDKYIAKRKEVGIALSEMGLAFTQLACVDEDGLGPALTEFGNTCDKCATSDHNEVELENSEFVEFVKDYIRIVNACREALTTRTKVGQNYKHAYTVLESKRSKLNKAKAGTKEEKIHEMQRDVTDAEKRLEEAKEHFELVAKRTDEEMVRYARQKVKDWKESLVGFANMQIKHYATLQQEWQKLLPDLEAIDANKP